MARNLPSGHYLQFNAGNIAGVHTWGAVAVLVKRDTVGTSWRGIVYTGNGGASDWGLSLEFTDTDVAWFGLGTGVQATGSHSMNTTTTWYFILISKGDGTSQPRAHYLNLSTGVWVHQNIGAPAGNASSPTTSMAVLGGWANGAAFDPLVGTIAAAAVYRGWHPNDAAVEAIDWETEAQAWVDAAANATLGAAVWIPGQTPINSQILDATGGGADETTSNMGTVVAGPTGFNETLSGDEEEIELEAGVSSTSSVSAALQVTKNLAAAVSSTTDLIAALRVEKLLAAVVESVTDVAADLQLANELEAAIESASSFSASLQVEKQMAAVIESVTDFQAEILSAILLAASISSTSSMDAELPLANHLMSVISSTSDVQAELQVIKELEATISSTSSIRAKLDIGQQTPFDPLYQVWVWGSNKWFDPQFIVGV